MSGYYPEILKLEKRPLVAKEETLRKAFDSVWKNVGNQGEKREDVEGRKLERGEAILVSFGGGGLGGGVGGWGGWGIQRHQEDFADESKMLKEICSGKVKRRVYGE